MIDDTPLRSAAADLIAAAGEQVPAIGLALAAVEQGLGRITVETVIGPEGVWSAVYFDAERGDREVTLIELGPDTGEQP